MAARLQALARLALSLARVGHLLARLALALCLGRWKAALTALELARVGSPIVQRTPHGLRLLAVLSGLSRLLLSLRLVWAQGR